MKKIFLFFCLIVFSVSSVCSQETENILTHYLSNFQYQKALQYIDSQEPTKDLLTKKAQCYRILGEYRKAIEILESLSKEYPGEISILSNLAVCYEAISQRQASAACYDRLIELDSANYYFKNQKAEILYQQGRYDGALSLFQSVYEQNDSQVALKKMAQCLDKMNMPDSAKIYFKQVWDANPDDAFSVANLTNICLKQGLIPEALAYSDKYIERDTTDQQVNLLNALCYYKMDDYEESIARFRKCYLRGDTSLIVNRSLGISYYSMNKSADAIKHLESAYRMDTTNNNVLFCLAVSYDDMADYEKSIPCYRKLLDRVIPDNIELYMYYKNLASGYDTTKDYPNALKSYIESLKYARVDQKMNIYYQVGVLCDRNLEDFKKAAEYYNLYRKSLEDYLKKEEAKENPVPQEIENVKTTIKHLDERLVELGEMSPK